MKFLLTILLCLAIPAYAADTAAEQALAAVKDLGAVNGQALACGEAESAQRAKALMLAHAPKTQTYGDAFQAGTQAGFADQTRAQPADCPAAPALAARLDQLEARLRVALPVPTAQ